MKYESSQEIGDVVVETYQGSGIIVPPKGWLKALQDWTHRQGTLFILDEIQSCMGRTGKMYCFEEERPDHWCCRESENCFETAICHHER